MQAIVGFVTSAMISAVGFAMAAAMRWAYAANGIELTGSSLVLRYALLGLGILGAVTAAWMLGEAVKDLFKWMRGAATSTERVPMMRIAKPVPGAKGNLNIVIADVGHDPTDLFKARRLLSADEVEAASAIDANSEEDAARAVHRAESGESVWLRIYATSREEGFQKLCNLIDNTAPANTETRARLQRLLGKVCELSYRDVQHASL